MNQEFKTQKDGPNVYRIVRDEDRHVLLECVWFSEPEDLGDGIVCEEEGQQLWVAKFFSDYFYKITG